MNNRKNLIIIVKGLIVGGTVLAPGVSGGSMAMILGVYHSGWFLYNPVAFVKGNKEYHSRFS